MNNKMEEIDLSRPKGHVVFDYLTLGVHCPYCNEGLKEYTRNGKWDEELRYKCGYHVRSKTYKIMEVRTMCKNSNEFKTLKKNRLKELDAVKKYVNKTVKDERLLKDILDRLDSSYYQITSWWGH